MTTKMRSSIPLACTAMAGLLLAACNSTAIRVGGLLTVLGLGLFIGVTLRRERRQDRAVKSTATGNR